MSDREQNRQMSRGKPVRHAIHRASDPDRESSIGYFVRERRKANRMSQADLGELAGVGTRFVSELERGKPTLRMDAVNRVLAVFGKTLAIGDAPRKAPAE